MTARTFRLYPEPQPWWSENDYAAVLDVMASFKPMRVLEFGPGSSTLALIEGGATTIDACEDNPDWQGVYETRLAQRFPEIVTIHAYTWADPLTIPAIDARRYDLALIDGPHKTPRRPVVLRYALARCARVLMPTEDVAYGRSALRPQIAQIAEELHCTVEWMETGPLSGGFALVTP